MAEQDKRSLISQTLIAQVEGFIYRNGRDYVAFVVGVTEDADQALARHNVNREKNKFFTVNALTGQRADSLTEHFAKKGCTIGEAGQSGFVYCYRRAFNTTP
jgi:hypothetical protein